MGIVKLESVSFSYGNRRILENINLDINKNQLLCLFGANGCGKTTLLDCITSMNVIESGKIFVKDKDLYDYSPRSLAKHIAYVPQKSQLTFPYKVMDVILMARASRLSIYSRPSKKDYEKCLDALETIGVLHLQDKLFTELSGGEAQLILIARALAQETELIIMDEPTAHLDYRYKYIVLNTIIELIKNKDVTIIMASHVPNHSYYLENNGIDVSVAILKDGKAYVNSILQDALTEETILNVYSVDVKKISFDHENYRKQNFIIPLGKRGCS